MNKPHEPTIRKFNPGTFQPDDEVIRQFVVRQRELGIVLDVVRHNLDAPACQHVLLVAPRGRGKTMLLARVAAEVRTNAALSERLLPVRFMEESQEVFDMGDFWLEALFHLAGEIAEPHPDLSRELSATQTDLAGRWAREDPEDRARAAVLDAADRLDKKLVLMVENLQTLSRDVDDDFGWKLRKTLQTEPRIILLATATSRFAGLDDANEPFFELFRTVCLEPLDTEECRRVWQMVGGEDRGREIRPLQILTGGNPRLLVIVADFARHRSLRQLMEELVTLIDDHTEYFRGHLEGFAKTERRVYLAVIDLWRPSSTGEIARRARLDVRSVSALLKRLVDRGAVVVEGSGRKRSYAAAERLYSIYYKLRRQRDEAAVVRSLIDFMVVFYSKDELTDLFRLFRAEAAQWPAIREGIERAMAESPQISAILSTIMQQNVEQTARSSETTSSTDIERFKNDVRDAVKEGNTGKMLEMAEQFLASQRADSSSQQQDISNVYALFIKGSAHSMRDETKEAMAIYDEIIGNSTNNDTPELQFLLTCTWINKGLTYEESGNFQAAIAAYDEVVARFGVSDAPEIQINIATALINKGAMQEALRNPEAAVQVYDQIIDRFKDDDAQKLQPQVASAFFSKGRVHQQLGNPEESLKAFDEMIKCFGTSDTLEIQANIAGALINKGMIQGQIGKTDAEIGAYDEVVRRFASSDVPKLQTRAASALFNKGVTQVQLGRLQEALHTWDELQRKFHALQNAAGIAFGWLAMRMKSVALQVQGNHSAAMEEFRSVYAGFVSGNEAGMGMMVEDVTSLIIFGASERELIEIISSDEEKAAPLAPLVVALRRRVGEDVRAPAEVLEVAEDIIQRIEEKKRDLDATPLDAPDR